MEWVWIAAPAVALLVAIGSWQWRLSTLLASKVSAKDLSDKFHALRGDLQANEHAAELRMTTLEQSLIAHRFETMDHYVKKVDLEQRLTRIDNTLEKQDEKLDTIAEKLTTLSALTKKAIA